MRRTIAAALAALIFLAPIAEAVTPGRLLVIGGEAYDPAERAALGVLNEWGVAYDFIRPTAARTSFCRAGVHTVGGPGGTSTITYVAVAHLGFKATPGASVAPGYDPDSLTRCGTNCATDWPAVPQLFAGVAGYTSANWTDDANACSTGIRGSPAAAISNAHARYKNYVVGQKEVWATTGYKPLAANQSAGGWYTRGIWRPVIGEGVGASAHAVALPLLTSSCGGAGDCDSVGRSNSPDSVRLWARYRSPADWDKPLVFVDYAGAFGSDLDADLFADGIAMLDSATGGRLITKQKKYSVTFSGLYNTCAYTNVDGSPDTLAPGLFCRADSCDTLNAYATADSFNTLKNVDGTRIPVGFAVDAESLAVVGMGYHKRLIQRFKNHYVALSSVSGSIAAANTNDAGRYSLHDIFGHTRRREVLPAGTTSLPAACAAGDTSIYCMVSRALARADSVFPGKVSKVLLPARGDWTPTTITANNAVALDTLLWAFVSLGIKGAVVSVMSNEHDVGRTTIPRGPMGWVSSQALLTARKPGVSGGAPIGTFKLLPTRGSDTYGPRFTWLLGNSSTHDLIQEESLGMWAGDWYWAHDAWHGHHQFERKTNVIRLSALTLGGSGQGTHAPRSAWWHVKWRVNRMNMMNKLAWQGHQVTKAVTLDELALEP